MIEASTTEIGVGSSIQFVATVVDETGVVIRERIVSWESSDEDVVTVSPGGLATAGVPGQSIITARTENAMGTLTMTVLSGPCRAESADPMAPGEVYELRLERFDCVFENGPFADGWVLTLQERTALTLSMASDDFDPLILVTSPDLEFVDYDDDGGDGDDAELFRVFEAGTYLVWATSFSPEETGAYRFAAEIAEVASCDEPLGSIVADSAVAGRLAPTSCDRQGRLMDPWRMTLAADTRVQIDLTSSDFDTYLYVADASGRMVALDDDGGAGLNSRWIGDLAAGAYTIWVTSFGGRQTGRYQLRLSTPAAGSASSSAPPGLLHSLRVPSLADAISADKTFTTAGGKPVG